MRQFPASPDQPPEKDPAYTWPWEESAKKPKEDDKAEKKPKDEKPKKPEKPADKKESKPKPQAEKPAEKQPPKPSEQEARERQEKRAELVERSLSLKKQYENVPVPHDPAVLARLLVAEHVLALDHQIKHPSKEPEAPSEDELLAALDTMGLLADKLENPDAETTPDIQTAYDTVLQLAEAALAEEAHIETIQEANEQAAHEVVDRAAAKSPGEPERTPTMPATALLIQTIVRLRDQGMTYAAIADYMTPQANQRSVTQEGGYTTAHTAGGNSTPHTINPTSSSSSVQSTPPSSPTEARATYRQTARHEQPLLPRTRVPHAIAPLALATLMVANRHHSPASARPPAQPGANYEHDIPTAEFTAAAASYVSPTTQSPYHTAAPRTHDHKTEISPIISRASAMERTTLQSDRPPAISPQLEPRHVSAHSEIHPAPTASRKLEHMPLQTLLAMATAVPLGYGSYLREAYEKGRIDKAGLVKVLKSRTKGRDYHMEYRKQAARHRLARLSPETTHAAETTASAPSMQPAAPALAREDAPAASTLHTPPSFAPASARTVQDLLQKPAAAKPIWMIHIVWVAALLAAIALLVVAVVIAMQP